MADVCDALSETAKLLRGLADQKDGMTMLRLSSPKEASLDDIRAIDVAELEFKLTGGAMEIKRLRAEIVRLSGMRGD